VVITDFCFENNNSFSLVVVVKRCGGNLSVFYYASLIYKENIMANAVGTWNLTTDWGCDGSITGSFNQTFKADGTWTSTPFVHNGRWFQSEGLIVWTFADTPNLVYSANLSGSWMSGIQGYETAGGAKGCFGGHKAGVPSAVKVAEGKGPDPTVGK
jgi:hypothetical protein